MSGFKPGEYADVIVGIRGDVTAAGDDWIEIAGQRVPTRLATSDDGVYHLSSDGTEPVYDDEPCPYCEDAADQLRELEDSWQRKVEAVHLEHHDAALAFCPDPLCEFLRREQGWKR